MNIFFILLWAAEANETKKEIESLTILVQVCWCLHISFRQVDDIVTVKNCQCLILTTGKLRWSVFTSVLLWHEHCQLSSLTFSSTVSCELGWVELSVPGWACQAAYPGQRGSQGKCLGHKWGSDWPPTTEQWTPTTDWASSWPAWGLLWAHAEGTHATIHKFPLAHTSVQAENMHPCAYMCTEYIRTYRDMCQHTYRYMQTDTLCMYGNKKSVY